MTTVNVQLGDITAIEVDAIVNAANEWLLGGGGVDGAIHDAAGPDLPARFVIHTVGPVWRGGRNGERELLAACYRNVLQLCPANDIQTLAIPAISCGAFGFPVREAASIAAREIRRAIEMGLNLDTIILVAFDPQTFAALSASTTG